LVEFGIEFLTNLYHHAAFLKIIATDNFEMVRDKLVVAREHPIVVGIDLRHLVEEDLPRSINGMGQVDAGFVGDENDGAGPRGAAEEGANVVFHPPCMGRIIGRYDLDVENIKVGQTVRDLFDEFKGAATIHKIVAIEIIANMMTHRASLPGGATC
jgi:hypothetical protein